MRTLRDLIDWIDAAMQRLPRGKAVRERVRHVRRLYGLLDEVDDDPSYRDDWHALAVKVAAILKEEAPAKPRRSSSAPRERKRWRPETPQRVHVSVVQKARPRRLAKKPGRVPIEMNAQLQAAFDAVAAGRQIVFVTGGAGTGKSTFIRELRERFQQKPSVVLAPTGVAALNAGGQTIHSFCRLPLSVVPAGVAKKAKDPELIETIELMIIDEISMVRADVLDGVDAFLRRNRKREVPFGGVQMVLVGDLFQLPPVVTRRDSEAIVARYETPFFFSAQSLRGLKFFPVELEIVYRQRDPAFAALLARLREGRNAGDAVRRLNDVCVGRTLGGRHLILVPTRAAAAAENDARLAALDAEPREFVATRTGSFASAPDDRLPAPERLVVKKGAQVMFLRNDAERRWVNGTLAEVTRLEDDVIHVRLEDGTAHEAARIEWEDIEYRVDEKKRVVEEVVGTYVQFPLMLAWAVTIHKAQGLTLDRVMVDLDRRAFADGQVYVALSRCRTMEGLSLRRPVRPFEIRCSEPARQFYERMRRRTSSRPESDGSSATSALPAEP